MSYKTKRSHLILIVMDSILYGRHMGYSIALAIIIVHFLK